MTFPEIVKTTLWDIIDEMSRSLFSFVKNPDLSEEDFTPDAKILLQSPLGHRNFFSRPEAYHWCY